MIEGGVTERITFIDIAANKRVVISIRSLSICFSTGQG